MRLSLFHFLLVVLTSSAVPIIRFSTYQSSREKSISKVGVRKVAIIPILVRICHRVSSTWSAYHFAFAEVMWRNTSPLRARSTQLPSHEDISVRVTGHLDLTLTNAEILRGNLKNYPSFDVFLIALSIPDRDKQRKRQVIIRMGLFRHIV